jgi:transposase-like protein
MTSSAYFIANKFNTKKKCIDYLVKTRWAKGKAICPFCNSKNTAKLGKELGRFHCNSCKTHFSVTVGTIFHDTRLSLPKWFHLIALMVNAKQGISSKELERDMDITYKTAWLCSMRVRCGMIESQQALQEVVEMDEAYVGGKPKKKNYRGEIVEYDIKLPENRPSICESNIDTRPNKRGRGTKKTPVVAIVERKGQVVLRVMKRLTSKNLLEMLYENVKLQPNTKVMTDDYRGYWKFDDIVKHFVIKHSKGEFVSLKDKSIHTNTIEGFFSILKRSIKGNYIAISKKYLPMYLAQAQFTYNHRHITKNLFDYFMKNALSHEKCMLNYKPIEEPDKIAYIPRKKKYQKTTCKRCMLPKKQPIHKRKTKKNGKRKK